tara:strand:+ start:275 stop:424 length:150 start_codon:yes stop_codon:yes gene_type:complete
MRGEKEQVKNFALTKILNRNKSKYTFVILLIIIGLINQKNGMKDSKTME